MQTLKRVMQRMPSPNGQGAGQTATINLPTDYTYHFVDLLLKDGATDVAVADMATKFPNLVLKIDGKAEMDISTAEYISILKHNGVVIVDGVLPLMFSRPWMRDAGSEDFTAIGTLDVATLTLEIKQASSGFTTGPAIELDAEISENTYLEYFVSMSENSASASAAGNYDFNQLSTEDGDILALHLASANITSASVKYRGVDIVEDIPVNSMQSKLANHNKPKAWQTGYYHLNFASNNRFDDRLYLSGGILQVKMAMSGSDTFNIVEERLKRRVRKG